MELSKVSVITSPSDTLRFLALGGIAGRDLKNNLLFFAFLFFPSFAHKVNLEQSGCLLIIKKPVLQIQQEPSRDGVKYLGVCTNCSFSSGFEVIFSPRVSQMKSESQKKTGEESQPTEE